MNDAAPLEAGGVAEKAETLRAKRLPPMDQRERVRRCLRQRHIRTLKAEESTMLPSGSQSLASDPEEAEALANLLVDHTMQLRDLFARGS